MNEEQEQVSMITYSDTQREIVKSGPEAIRHVLINGTAGGIRSLLFCLDQYLDPYYGYKLEYADEIFAMLEQHLFMPHEKEAKEDMLQLLGQYGQGPLDLLADRLDEVEPELLAEAIETLGLTFKGKYELILSRYIKHGDSEVEQAASAALSYIRSV
ncbi:hypothetical protein ACX93W_09425 [Paenibacillus sp. CAU 1782]